MNHFHPQPYNITDMKDTSKGHTTAMMMTISSQWRWSASCVAILSFPSAFYTCTKETKLSVSNTLNIGFTWLLQFIESKGCNPKFHPHHIPGPCSTSQSHHKGCGRHFQIQACTHPKLSYLSAIEIITSVCLKHILWQSVFSDTLPLKDTDNSRCLV